VVVSATARLPLRRFPATHASLHEIERRARDLDWNAQRWPQTLERFANLVAQKARLIDAKPTDRAERREWFRRLQAVTRELRPAVAREREGTQASLKRFGSEMKANAILASREYAWPLFPESSLRNLFARFG
jgi:arginyl-tRNA synthetase